MAAGKSTDCLNSNKTRVFDSEQNLMESTIEESESKFLKKSRALNIPYILNGELYEIQTRDGENVTVRCCHCPPNRVYRGSVRSTGNFHMHIKRRHPDLLGKLHEMKVQALLERRDRLMNVRKLNIDRENSLNEAVKKIKKELKTSDSPSQVAPQLNLKIKAVFQRHQLQQRQRATRNWNNATGSNNFVDRNNMEVDENYDDFEPLDFSLKEKTAMCVGNLNQEQIETDTEHARGEPNQQQLCNNSNIENKIRSVSNASSSSSDLHISTSLIDETIPIIKNEIIQYSDQALDLTVSKNLTNNRCIVRGSNNSSAVTTSTSFHQVVPAANVKWNEVLLHVESSLREIHQEMHTRNQIESNRLFLDIAKFKHLNPGFQFQW